MSTSTSTSIPAPTSTSTIPKNLPECVAQCNKNYTFENSKKRCIDYCHHLHLFRMSKVGSSVYTPAGNPPASY